jgi:hypothetical protein
MAELIIPHKMVYFKDFTTCIFLCCSWGKLSLVPPAGGRLLGEGAVSALALTED